MTDVRDNLKNLPDKPGVYIHKDKLGNVIYVGKAVSLKNRVRQYFQSKKNMPPKVRSMVDHISEFEYITTGSEMEALILECNLIKKYRPKYNVLLRDDKTYPYIKITGEEYPRIIKTRTVVKDGGKYFGPYSDAGAVNKTVDLLNSTFALKRCSAAAFPENFKPCLNYHINQCRGICNGNVDKAEYDRAIDGAKEFLSGKNKQMISMLEEKMMSAAEQLDFEGAAMYRDYIESTKALSATQRVVMHHNHEADIVIPARGKEEVHVVLFFVRDGKLVGRESHRMEADYNSNKKEVVAAFLNQHYSKVPEIPKEILVSELPEDYQLLENFLTDISEHNIRIISPQRGEKKALLDMAAKDVIEMVKTIDEKAEAAKQREETLGHDLFDVLKTMKGDGGQYDGKIYRIEAYDISNTNGVDIVGAMVVFEGTRADKSSYRKFKVKSVKGQDDYGSMREVLSRRFRRVLEGDEAFELLPDAIFMDGGKGQVSIALEVLDAVGFEIPVLGMVKDDKHRTRGLLFRNTDGNYEEITIADKPMLMKYVGRIQEEVHRFAIEYHRKLRSKKASTSILDNISGIGAARREALLKHFKSIDAIKAAEKEELEKVTGMNSAAAESVWQYFHT